MCVQRLPCLTSSVTHLTLGQLTLLGNSAPSYQLYSLTSLSLSTLYEFSQLHWLALACSCVISESTFHVLCCAGTEAFSHPFLLFSWGLSCSFETGSWPLFTQKCAGSRSVIVGAMELPMYAVKTLLDYSREKVCTVYSFKLVTIVTYNFGFLYSIQNYLALFYVLKI